MKGKVIRVAIVGPESAGKTTLATDLFDYFTVHNPGISVQVVYEYARSYCEKMENVAFEAFTPKNFKSIVQGQISAESAHKEGLVICDTGADATEIWFRRWTKLDAQRPYNYSSTLGWFSQKTEDHHYDLCLLATPNIPYEQDPLRYFPEEAMDFYKQFQAVLRAKHIPNLVIDAKSKEKRVQQAVEAINELLLAAEQLVAFKLP